MRGFQRGRRKTKLGPHFFFFLLTRVYHRSVLIIRRVTNERVWEYLHVIDVNILARVSLGSAVESGLLTQEYGYFHMLYREGGGEVNKSCP
jgi:hypothetical protein